MTAQELLDRMKYSNADLDFWMQRMKYGGADPMLELGVRMDPRMQVLPNILNPSVQQAQVGVNISPRLAKKRFGKETASAPEIFAQSNRYKDLTSMYKDLSNRGLLAESIKSVEDLEAYPQYPMDKGFIGYWSDDLGRQVWNHELRHEGLEALGYNIPHVTEEVLTRMYDLEYGTESEKKFARFYLEEVAEDNKMSVEELMEYMKRNVPSRFARDTDALRMIDRLKTKYKEERE